MLIGPCLIVKGRSGLKVLLLNSIKNAMSVKKGQVLKIEIEKLAYGGKGVGRVDGLAVFVGGAVPGDEVQARITRKKKSHAEARIVELIRPSPFRVEAPCPYSGFCGGCTWQYLDYGRQLDFKREQVAESLHHIGRLTDVPVHPVIPSEKKFEYRNKMEFTFSDRRWLLPEELSQDYASRDFALGLHVPGTFDKVIDIRSCLLIPEAGSRILQTVRRYASQSGIPPYGLKSHKGFWRFLVVRHSVARDAWMVNIVTSEEQPAWIRPLADLLQNFQNIVSVVNNINTRKAGIAVGEWEKCLAGASSISDRIAGFEFEISANSFFQTNTTGAARLYETMKAYARLTGNETVLDLYSGTGTIPILLSDSAREVVGIEISDSAVRNARKNCENNAIGNCQFICGDIMAGLRGVRGRPDVLIIDPPRSGMHKNVTKMVRDLAPDRIIYLSCNPATLARDLALLKEDYHPAEIQPIDMFPHTYHIECVARLEKAS